MQTNFPKQPLSNSKKIVKEIYCEDLYNHLRAENMTSKKTVEKFDCLVNEFFSSVILDPNVRRFIDNFLKWFGVKWKRSGRKYKNFLTIANIKHLKSTKFSVLLFSSIHLLSNA